MGAPPESDREAIIGFDCLHRVAQSYLGPLWIASDAREGSGALRLLRRLALPDDTPAEARREIAALGEKARGITHRNVLRTVHVVEQGELLALVYEHAEAEPLRSLQSWANLRGLSFPVGVALRVVVDLLQGLHAVHALGESAPGSTIAGGLSPDSVLIARDGSTMLCDALVAGGAALLEGVGFNTAKLAYAAPEQVHATSGPTPRADVFTCAAMLWELLASRRLLAGSRPAIERKLLEHNLPSLRTSLKAQQQVSDELVALVERALSADPGDRPASAAELARALGECGHELASVDEVAAFVGKLSGPRFDRRTAAIRSRSGQAEEGAKPESSRDIETPRADSFLPSTERSVEEPFAPTASSREAELAADSEEESTTDLDAAPPAPASEVSSSPYSATLATPGAMLSKTWLGPGTPPVSGVATATGSSPQASPAKSSPTAAATPSSPQAAGAAPLGTSKSSPQAAAGLGSSPTAAASSPVASPPGPPRPVLGPPPLLAPPPAGATAASLAVTPQMPPVASSQGGHTITGLGASQHPALAVNLPFTNLTPPPFRAVQEGASAPPPAPELPASQRPIAPFGATSLHADDPEAAAEGPLPFAHLLPKSKRAPTQRTSLTPGSQSYFDLHAQPQKSGGLAELVARNKVVVGVALALLLGVGAWLAIGKRPAAVTASSEPPAATAPSAPAPEPASAVPAPAPAPPSEPKLAADAGPAPSEAVPAPAPAAAPAQAKAADFAAAKLDDSQLVVLFELEGKSTLPTCAERLGAGASKYTGNDMRRSELQVKAARRQLEKGDAMAAHELACSAVAHSPKNPAAQRVLAELALQLGDPAQAKAAIDRALARTPKDKALQALRGDALALMGDIAGSRAVYQRLGPARGAKAARIKKLLIANKKLGDKALAAADWSEAASLFRRNVVLTQGAFAPSTQLAEALLGLDRSRAALVWAERAAQASPRDSRTQLLFGDALYENGQNDKARVAWQAALSYDRNNRLAARRLREGKP